MNIIVQYISKFTFRLTCENCYLDQLVQPIKVKFYADRILYKMNDVMQSSLNKSNSKTVMQNHLLQAQALDDEFTWQEIDPSIRNFFTSYVEHIKSMNNTFYSLSNLLTENESLLVDRTPIHKFYEKIQTLKADMSQLSNELIDQLTVNNKPVIDGCERRGRSLNIASNLSDNTVDTVLRRVADLIDFRSCENSSNKRKLESDKETEQKRTKIEPSSESSHATLQKDKNENLKFNSEGLLVVYIDGSCLSNGKTGAQAGFGVWFNYDHPLNVYSPVTGVPTNNNAEIQAATKAIQIASDIGIRKIKLRTDSQFLINCMTQWIHKWKRNNWINTANQPVKNKESLKALDLVMALMEKVEWDYVPGHKGIAGNMEADVLAKKGATLYKP